MEAQEAKRYELRTAVVTYDSIQKLRIALGNRIVQDHYRRSGMKPGEKISDSKKVRELKKLVKEYELVTNVIAFFSRIERKKYWLINKGGILNETQFNCILQYMMLHNSEKETAKQMVPLVNEFSIYTAYLSKVYGCGPTIGAYIIAYMDIHTATTIASFWKYCGLDVVNGVARSMKKEHLIDVVYINKKGEEKTRKSITFCPFIKAKLLEVFAGCVIKAQRYEGNIYYQVYENRLEYEKLMTQDKVYTSGDHEGKPYTEYHLQNRAKRYMVKMFLQDLWLEWRRQEGLPITEPYHEKVLGKKHHGMGGAELVDLRKSGFDTKTTPPNAV